MFGLLFVSCICLVLAEEAVETVLRRLERQRFREARKRTIELGAEIRGFYHTSAWQKHWREVVTEQLRMIDGYNQSTPSLLRLADSLHVTIADSNGDFMTMQSHILSLDLRFRKRIRFVHNATIPRATYREANEAKKAALRAREASERISEGEFATVMALHQYCRQRVKEGKRAYIFYFHNKGGCCPKTPPSPVSDWRDEMNAFNLEFPSICLRALNDGYSTCGVEYQFYGGGHYSGNFFWANCAHVSRLPPLWDALNNAWDAEFFLFKTKSFANEHTFGDKCGFNPFHCKVNHYDNRCPRNKYLGVLQALVGNKSVSASPPETCTK